MSIGNIPDDIRVPLVYLDIDNSQASENSPAAVRKLLVIGQQFNWGGALPLQPVQVTSDSLADNYFCKGSQLAEMLKIARKANRYTECWAMGVPDLEEGTAAQAKLTFSGMTDVNGGMLYLLINGCEVQVEIPALTESNEVPQMVVSRINNYPQTQVEPSFSSAEPGVVTLTVLWAGQTGNDCDVRLNYYNGEATPVGLKCSITPFTGGTGTPDAAAIVAAMGDTWFTDIVFPYNDTQSLDVLRDELLDRWGPLKMMEAQVWTAFRGTHAESTTFGDSRNDWLISCLGTNLSPQPTWLWAASYGGLAAYYLAQDPARPLQTLVMTGILPPAKTQRWDVTERNLLLHDGIATHSVNASDQVCIDREITMYRVNSYGDPDTSYLDVQSPATLGRIRSIIKNRFTTRYSRYKLADDDVLELLDPGQPVMTPKICRNELLDIAQTELIPAGLVENFDDYKDTLEVARDSSDKNRLNFICHPNLVNQLRVLAGLIQFKS